MAVIIALGIVLAFIVFGACERLVPKAGRFLSPLSGVALALASLWGLYLGSSWGLHRLGITSNQLPGFLNTTAWMSATTGQVLIVAGITVLIGVLLLPVCLSWRKIFRAGGHGERQGNPGQAGATYGDR